MLQAGVDLWGSAREKQYHTGKKHQDRQDRRGQPRSGANGLLREQQAARFIGQQQNAGQQQRHDHVDQSVQQQGSGQGRGPELVGKGGQQDRLEHADTTGDMAEHACGKRQQVDQDERGKGRGLR
ncbi:hypothetical protein D3C76_692140 [compost metagenome]